MKGKATRCVQYECVIYAVQLWARKKHALCEEPTEFIFSLFNALSV